MTTASDNLVLPDTSVWIDYFRKKRPVFEAMEQLIENDRVCIINLVLAEILCGAASDTEFAALQGAVEVFHLLEEQDNTWIEAARLSTLLRRHGKTVGLADCYIATMTHQHHVTLWSFDKHFQMIHDRLKINLFK